MRCVLALAFLFLVALPSVFRAQSTDSSLAGHVTDPSEAAIADGFADIELLKRRTGAGTGPCQGKLCHGEMLACLAEAGRPVALPTVRPLLRPTTLAALAAADSAS